LSLEKKRERGGSSYYFLRMGKRNREKRSKKRVSVGARKEGKGERNDAVFQKENLKRSAKEKGGSARHGRREKGNTPEKRKVKRGNKKKRKKYFLLIRREKEGSEVFLLPLHEGGGKK